MAVKFSQFALLLSLPYFTFEDVENDGMFTSSTDLQGLIVTESELVMKLTQYLMEESQRIEKVRKLIKQYEDLRDTAVGGEEKFVGNPLNSFLLIKKLTSDWKTLQSLIENTAGETLLASLTEERESDGLKWPSDEDLNGAAVGLMRLQDTYRLDTDSLARGVLNGHNYGPTLSAHHISTSPDEKRKMHSPV